MKHTTEQKGNPLRRLPGVLLVLAAFAALVLNQGCRGSGHARESAAPGPENGGPGAPPASGYAPGVYEGTGRGYRGPVQVRIQVSPAGIEDIAVIRHMERYPGTAALEELTGAVLETGSVDLDTVSGATFSSQGFIEAVEDALEKARRGMHP